MNFVTWLIMAIGIGLCIVFIGTILFFFVDILQGFEDED